MTMPQSHHQKKGFCSDAVTLMSKFTALMHNSACEDAKLFNKDTTIGAAECVQTYVGSNEIWLE
jgi:hypothetical protein